MCVGLWCLTAVFASASADAETDGKYHRGKPVGRGRWRTDNLETGDSGHSATDTSIRVEVLPHQHRSERRRVRDWRGWLSEGVAADVRRTARA